MWPQLKAGPNNLDLDLDLDLDLLYLSLLHEQRDYIQHPQS